MRIAKRITALVLAVVMVLAVTGCKKADGLWKDATYTKDKELGKGALTCQVEIKAEDKSITVTLHTDAENLGDALLENKLVEGDTTEFGLYIVSVNGIRADYEKDQAYWALSENGEYAMTGADGIILAEGGHYELTYTKA